MKLNKKYIIDKVDKLIYSIDWEWNSPNEKIFEEIVMSIARDGFNAGAEAMRKECGRKLVYVSLPLTLGNVFAAIQGAAVTFEERK